MRPRDFLAIAESLSKVGTEAANKSAASRAYYAVFHAAIHLAGPRVTNGPLQHQMAEDYVRKVHPSHIFAYRTLRDRRVEADYHLSSRMSQGRAQELVLRASRILDGIEQTQHRDAQLPARGSSPPESHTTAGRESRPPASNRRTSRLESALSAESRDAIRRYIEAASRAGDEEPESPA